MNKIFLEKALIIICFLFSLTACQQKGLSDYSSPEAAFETYINQGLTLRIVADHRHYRRAIRCFTDEEWAWFEKNFDKIEFEKEEFYPRLYKSKKKAYVFGHYVVKNGPLLDDISYSIENISDTEVSVTVKGYPEKIKMVKGKRGWNIVSLFGIDKSKIE